MKGKQIEEMEEQQRIEESYAQNERKSKPLRRGTNRTPKKKKRKK